MTSDHPNSDPAELSDSEYLCGLADRLCHIPVQYGTDDGDIDRLYALAAKLKLREEDEAAEVATSSRSRDVGCYFEFPGGEPCILDEDHPDDHISTEGSRARPTRLLRSPAAKRKAT